MTFFFKRWYFAFAFWGLKRKVVFWSKCIAIIMIILQISFVLKLKIYKLEIGGFIELRR